MTAETSIRPKVRVEKVFCDRGVDIIHCLVHVGGRSYKAPFDEVSSTLRDRIFLGSGVELTVSEMMTVTNAAREQLENEASYLRDYLMTQPAGTIAVLVNDLALWLAAGKEIVWAQDVTFGQTRPDEVFPTPIEDIGQIDTEELYELSQNIRNWLKAPTPLFEYAEWVAGVNAEYASHDLG